MPLLILMLLQPIHMDVSDVKKPVMEMLEYEPDSPTQVFVLEKMTGKQYVACFPSDCPHGCTPKWAIG